MRQSNLLLFILGFATFSLISCHQFTFYSFGGVEHVDLPDINSAREYLQADGSIAFANYSDTVRTTGWAFFHVITNGEYNDYDQTYAAGFLEGYLSRAYIYDAYLNFVDSVLKKNPDLTENAYNYISNQTNWLKSQCANITGNATYWGVVCAQLQQVYGMYDGYIAGIQGDQTPSKLLDFAHFYYLTNTGDLEDIVPAFNITESYAFKGRRPENMDCTIFVKLIENDLVVSHNTHNIFGLMLRIYKTYEIHYNNPDVNAKTVSFSSRPGDLESKDDFYITDSKLVVMETSFNTYNLSNYGFLHYDSVPVWIRAQTATRLAKNSSHWTTIFQMYRSGTHNSQWVIVDMNKYGEQKNLPKDQLSNIVWMCEEFYYVLNAFDVTQTFLVNQGYVAGYNVPYSPEIIQISNYTSTFNNDTRAIIFDKYGKDVNSLEGAKSIIRLNNNLTGNFCEAIAPRCDVMGPGEYDFGAIDGKATSYSLIGTNSTWMVSSPSFNDLIPPFDWRKFPEVARNGMPDVYNFEWILYNFNNMPTHSQSDNAIVINDDFAI